MECNQILSQIFYIIKNIMVLINIVCPIILIISLITQFTKLMISPDQKNGMSKIKNSIIALFVAFFIPLMVNVILSWFDTNYNITNCIKNAKYDNQTPSYVDINDNSKKKKSIKSDPSKYEKSESKGKKIAKLAVALSPTAAPDDHLYAPNANPWLKINDSRLNDYFEVMDETIGKYNDNNAYGSCAQAAAGVIRATVDPDFDTMGPKTQIEYLQANTEKWKYVGTVNAGEKFDEKCKPGDLLICSTHTMIYVGNKLAREKFPNTTGNMFQASYDDGGPSAPTYAKYPSIDSVITEGRTFYIYRPTSKGNYTKPFISTKKYLKY